MSADGSWDLTRRLKS